MGEKAEQKREYILREARKVFAKKGFKDVTMKDIVSQCGISRGGIYLYFNSTDELFEAVLQAEGGQIPAAEPADGCSAGQQMKRFLDAQKNELLHPGDSLITATYEYLFARRSILSPTELNKKFEYSVAWLSGIIKAGVEQGEFLAEPSAAAQNIVLLLEGLRISSTVMDFEEAFLDRQMEYVLRQLEGGKQK